MPSIQPGCICGLYVHVKRQVYQPFGRQNEADPTNRGTGGVRKGITLKPRSRFLHLHYFSIARTASLMIEAPHRNPLIGVRAGRSCVLVGVGEVSLKENPRLRRILLPVPLPTKSVS